MTGAMHARGWCMAEVHACQGDMHAGWTCMRGGMYEKGACTQGVCAGGVHAGKTATEAGGTHPTGMYSCYVWRPVL